MNFHEHSFHYKFFNEMNYSYFISQNERDGHIPRYGGPCLNAPQHQKAEQKQKQTTNQQNHTYT